VSVLEHVVLTIDPADAHDFAAAFIEARPLIEGQHGCGGARLLEVIETPGRYVLLVEWATLEDHMEGFRNSAEYPRWSDLLHHFYVTPVVVEHGTDVRPA
jgi:heme-degrading monooxygenase HmoA